MALIIGIDPGNSGALVALDRGIPVEWIRMPTMEIGKSTRVNAAELGRWLKDRQHADNLVHAFVESTAAMPGQGVTSMYTFGHAAGTIMGVLGALEIPHTMVKPLAWKKNAGLVGTEKDAARARAIQLWPYWADLSAKIKGQAFADAALIARHGQK